MRRDVGGPRCGWQHRSIVRTQGALLPVSEAPDEPWEFLQDVTDEVGYGSVELDGEKT